MATTEQVHFTADELLTSDEIVEPLTVGGVRCHGGFKADGTYSSPRTKVRAPAIAAWGDRRLEQFHTDPLDIPLETWPENFPNVEQSRFLIRHGVIEPIVGTLTRIGTLEGYGSILRTLPVPDLQKAFVEDIDGTATAHIDRGLFEAHARDESGFDGQAGHNTMWFAARDIAFENPTVVDQTAALMNRGGVGVGGSRIGATTPPPKRSLPDDIDPMLEVLLARMIGLLLIEISAFHVFRWAHTILSDQDLVAGDGEAGQLVTYIRSDEATHVAWLTTSLSEMRDRTWIGQSGKRYAGTEMVGRLWNEAVHASTVNRRAESLAFAMNEIERALKGRPGRRDLVAEMLSLGSVIRAPDGSYVDVDVASGGDAA